MKMKVKDLPDKLRNGCYRSWGYYLPSHPNGKADPEIDESDVPQRDASEVQYNDLVLVPDNGYDLRECNMRVVTTLNLQELAKMPAIQGGPYTRVLKKDDAAQPAYLLMEFEDGGLFYYKL